MLLQRPMVGGYRRLLCAGIAALSLSACNATLDALGGGGEDPEEEKEEALPRPVDPCADAACWESEILPQACAPTSVGEDFSTGNYNVHAYSIPLAAEMLHRIILQANTGAWEPIIMVRSAAGETLYDGELGIDRPELAVSGLDLPGDGAIGIEIATLDAIEVTVYVSGREVSTSSYSSFLPMDATYTLTHDPACDAEPESGGLISPPNFDSGDLLGGYHLLPLSDPESLYERKRDACSRGNKLLIDVIYTVATRWRERNPGAAPLQIRDLNECSPRQSGDADHQTHDDGTHFDIVAGCATSVTCDDPRQAVELAKLFVDTGVACGILFNRTSVQDDVNVYFEGKFGYAPWKSGQFMRTVSGHVSHFHVRVKKPDGTCN